MPRRRQQPKNSVHRKPFTIITIMTDSIQKEVHILAAVDIGSNAARMLIKRVVVTPAGVRMKKLQFLPIPLRLGMDVFTTGRIGEEREEMLLRTMKIFRHMLVLYNVEYCLIYAISAFRDASNGAKILNDIKKKTKMEIQIISGEEEARIIRLADSMINMMAVRLCLPQHDRCNI